jgi:hypothetical protein
MGHVMNSERLKIKIMPAAEEGPLTSEGFRNAVGDFYDAVRKDGIEVQPTHYVFDSVAGGGGLNGAFDFAATALPAVSGLVIGWLTARAGRKVRLKVGDIEVEAQTVEQVKELLKLAEKQKKKTDRG